MTSHVRLAGFLLPALIAAVPSVASAQPATPPATAPVAALDGPRAALAGLLDALARHDAPAVVALSAVDDEQARPYVEATARMLVAGRRMADAATARFGPAGDALGKGPIVPADASGLADAQVTETERDGRRVAEVLLPGHTLPLRFVRDSAGAWRFKVLDYAGTQERDLDAQTRLIEMFGTALSESADEIAADRYGTVADAEAAIRQKLNNVLMRSLTPSPTTAPTTRP